MTTKVVGPLGFQPRQLSNLENPLRAGSINPVCWQVTSWANVKWCREWGTIPQEDLHVASIYFEYMLYANSKHPGKKKDGPADPSPTGTPLKGKGFKAFAYEQFRHNRMKIGVAKENRTPVITLRGFLPTTSR